MSRLNVVLHCVCTLYVHAPKDYTFHSKENELIDEPEGETYVINHLQPVTKVVFYMFCFLSLLN